MRTLRLLILILFLATTPQPAAATEIPIGVKGTPLLHESNEVPGAKLPSWPTDIQHLQDIQGTDDTRQEGPEPQRHATRRASPALNDGISANLFTVMDISHNSSLVLTCKGTRFCQVDGDIEHCPVAVEDSADMKDDSSAALKSIPLHSLLSQCEQSKSLIAKAITDANLCKSEQSGFRSGTCSQDATSSVTASYDHQSIVILEDDPVVMESASFLYEKDPTVSTLLSYQRGALQVIQGTSVRLTADSHVLLVGHGSRATDGEALLGGHRAEEVARVVDTMETVDGRVRTVSVVGCELGKELAFATRLLQALRHLRVEATLHLRRSALSVTRSGEIVTRDGGDSLPVWRHGDDSNKVIAWLDGAGNLLTKVEESQRGQVIPHYQAPLCKALHLYIILK
ncbi:hypothetical protein ACEWY4_026074 [Coilia grayii]|uniref:Peptidase C80 domain-containing protein n=1 Tax=Coilia grayii TaxID=363190 RepID=A0ABD1ITT1_9TELE